ncbi:hypothetical protein Psi02_11560 [Planotetraspora silvatica]|uniref:Polysaccharide chain length determinant N-terminal domain-containing protein n=1 Tax=Planotetraspora silvatica TaxID=234614 RepID=A0A8J3UGX3_9ACTN|nr:hypothetical protein [Planotetraspora silvatica]GII44732.1 hypothetical protein Psi02_11560 [Planotetraspora silvatica]
MELVEYGRWHRGIILPLAAIPLIAAIGGAAWAIAQPPTYRHVVELQVASPTDTTGAAMTEQSVATFRTLVTSSAVIATVAKKADVDPGTLMSGLSTERPNTDNERGTVVQVIYVGEDARQAAVITRATALAAVDDLMRPYVAQAESEVKGAKKASDDSAKALAKAVAKSGLAPDRYTVLYAEITRLQSELAAPTGDRDRNDILKAIDDRQKQLSRLTPDLVPFMSVQNEADQANRYLVQVQQGLHDAQARLTQSEASITPVTPEGVAQGKTSLVVRVVAMAGGVGALLAVVILLLRELVRQRRPVSHLGPPRVSAALLTPSGTAPIPVSPQEVRVIERGDRNGSDQQRQLR